MNDFVNNTKVNVFTQKVFDATNSTRERRQLIIDHCISSCIKVNQCKYVLPSKCKVQYVLCMSVAVIMSLCAVMHCYLLSIWIGFFH